MGIPVHDLPDDHICWEFLSDDDLSCSKGLPSCPSCVDEDDYEEMEEDEREGEIFIKGSQPNDPTSCPFATVDSAVLEWYGSLREDPALLAAPLAEFAEITVQFLYPGLLPDEDNVEMVAISEDGRWFVLRSGRASQFDGARLLEARWLAELSRDAAAAQRWWEDTQAPESGRVDPQHVMQGLLGLIAEQAQFRLSVRLSSARPTLSQALRQWEQRPKQ